MPSADCEHPVKPQNQGFQLLHFRLHFGCPLLVFYIFRLPVRRVGPLQYTLSGIRERNQHVKQHLCCGEKVLFCGSTADSADNVGSLVAIGQRGSHGKNLVDSEM
jgi:hypothetical protein